MAPRCSRCRWGNSCRDGHCWVWLWGCGSSSWCVSGLGRSAPGWCCDLRLTVNWICAKHRAMEDVLKRDLHLPWRKGNLVLSCKLPSLNDSLSVWEPCLFRDSLSARSSSRRSTITWCQSHRTAGVRSSSENLQCLKLIMNLKENHLWSWAQKCCQTLWIKVRFTCGFVSCFPGEVRICQNKNAVSTVFKYRETPSLQTFSLFCSVLHLSYQVCTVAIGITASSKQCTLNFDPLSLKNDITVPSVFIMQREQPWRRNLLLSLIQWTVKLDFCI